MLAILEEKGVRKVVEDPDNTSANYGKEDSTAKAIIIQCITDKHLEYVKDKRHAKDMLEALQNVFERKSVFTKLYIKKKLLSLKLKYNEKLEQHFV